MYVTSKEKKKQKEKSAAAGSRLRAGNRTIRRVYHRLAHTPQGGDGQFLMENPPTQA